MKREKKFLTPAQRRRRKTWLTVSVIIVVVLACLTAGVLALRDRVTESFASSNAPEVESAAVTVGSITTTVSGTGTLSDEDAQEVTFPTALKLDKVYVEEGDAVDEGAVLASVNTASILSALADTQAQLDELDEELSDAGSDTVSSALTARVAGRVKAVYAAPGDDVATVMYDRGALALLSLDGLMAAELETEAVTAGQSVSVTLEDGTAVSGTVESAAEGRAVVTISDNGPVPGESVTVTDAQGTVLGTGLLTVHNELPITGYAGTVYAVYARENQNVYAGSTLFYLTDTSYTANYDALLQERRELEDTLQELITIYKEGAIRAPLSGVVSAVSYDVDAANGANAAGATATAAAAATGTAAGTDSRDGTLLLTLAPNKTMSVTLNVDESKILSLSEGQAATVTVDSLGDEAFEGVVTKVDTAGGSSSNGVTRYSVTISLDKDSRMLSGMSAAAAIRIESVDNALLIPSEALTKTRTTAYVYTTYNAETGELGGQVEVTAGLDNGTSVVITSGLSQGDTVWYEPSVEPLFTFYATNGNGGNHGGERPEGDMPGGGGRIEGVTRSFGG